MIIPCFDLMLSKARLFRVALEVVRVQLPAIEAVPAPGVASPLQATALLVWPLGLRRLKSQDALGGLLGGDDNVGRRVSGHHAREDGGIDNEEVVGAIDLGVKINNGGSVVLATVVGTHLVGADPVVGAAVGPRDDHLDPVSQLSD